MFQKSKFLFLLVIVFNFSACSDTKLVEIKDDNGKLVEKYFLDKKTNKKEGIFESFNDNGSLFEKSEYSNGLLNGKRYIYFDNGQIEIEETHVNGKYEGIFKTFYDSGNIKSEGLYVNNTMEGEWINYYKSGQIKEKVVFENNLENGHFVEYFENGVLAAEGTYKDGDFEEGLLKVYNEDGSLNREMLCKHGICKTIKK